MAVHGFPGAEPDKIIEEIKEKAAIYTQDWRFNQEYPDMGTALAILFADMMGDTVKKFYKLPRRYQVQFYNLLDAGLLPASEAKGYVTFSTVNKDVEGTLVKSGTRVTGTSEGEKPVIFETGEDVYVSSAQLENIYYVNGNSDYISSPLEFPIAVSQTDNRQSHFFYIGHSALFFIKTEGELIMDFHLSNNVYSKEQEQLLMNQMIWSYYSEKGFVEFSDFQYESGRIYLKKDKRMPVFMQTEIQGKDSFWIRAETRDMKPESRITFQELSIAARGCYIDPEIIYDGTMELDKESFMPFGEHPYPYAEVYISSDEVFSKKGAFLELCFDLEFLKFPGELKSPEYPIHWRTVMHRSEFKEPEPVDIVIDSVIWEYYNGFGWSRIPGTKEYEAVFQMKQEQERIIVGFWCPEDIYPFLIAARESYCIRFRISKMVHLYAMDGIYVVPCIKNLTLNYEYKEAPILPEHAYAVNQLITEEVKCGSQFVPFYNLFPDKEMLYLSFSNPLDEVGIRLLFVLEKEKREKHVRYRYEYYGKTGWSPLKVEDETLHLSKTGIVTTYAFHSFVRQEFFEHKGYWIRIVQETDAERTEKTGFPPITGIYLNSTIVSAEQESGRCGNLPAGSICAMERTIGFINKVVNHEPMTGGCNEESCDQAIKRNAAFLRHQGKAVTARDFEDIVYSGVRNILQVKCFSGRNENGEKMPGHITLAVLPEGGIGGDIHFEYTKENIYQSLMPHIDRRVYDEGRLHIVEPEWILMKVYATIVVKDSMRLYQLKEKITQRINGFIHPVTGNFDGSGWKIGTLPSVLQIQNACSQMEEICYIKNLSLKDETGFGIYALGIGGEQEIEILSM